MKKSNIYDEKNPILDATVDRPISAHLTHDEPASGDDGVCCMPLSLRGATTIKHTDLNRHRLRRARLNVYLATLKLMNKVNRNRDHPKVPVLIQQLREKAVRQFGSVIAFVMERTEVANEPGS